MNFIDNILNRIEAWILTVTGSDRIANLFTGEIALLTLPLFIAVITLVSFEARNYLVRRSTCKTLKAYKASEPGALTIVLLDPVGFKFRERRQKYDFATKARAAMDTALELLNPVGSDEDAKLFARTLAYPRSVKWPASKTAAEASTLVRASLSKSLHETGADIAVALRHADRDGMLIFETNGEGRLQAGVAMNAIVGFTRSNQAELAETLGEASAFFAINALKSDTAPPQIWSPSKRAAYVNKLAGLAAHKPSGADRYIKQIDETLASLCLIIAQRDLPSIELGEKIVEFWRRSLAETRKGTEEYYTAKYELVYSLPLINEQEEAILLLESLINAELPISLESKVMCMVVGEVRSSDTNFVRIHIDEILTQDNYWLRIAKAYLEKRICDDLTGSELKKQQQLSKSYFENLLNEATEIQSTVGSELLSWIIVYWAEHSANTMKTRDTAEQRLNEIDDALTKFQTYKKIIALDPSVRSDFFVSMAEISLQEAALIIEQQAPLAKKRSLNLLSVYNEFLDHRGRDLPKSQLADFLYKRGICFSRLAKYCQYLGENKSKNYFERSISDYESVIDIYESDQIVSTPGSESHRLMAISQRGAARLELRNNEMVTAKAKLGSASLHQYIAEANSWIKDLTYCMQHELWRENFVCRAATAGHLAEMNVHIATCLIECDNIMGALFTFTAARAWLERSEAIYRSISDSYLSNAKKLRKDNVIIQIEGLRSQYPDAAEAFDAE